MGMVFLGVKEVAKLMDVGEDWVSEQCRAGKLPHAFFNRKYRIRPEDLERFANRLVAESMQRFQLEL